MARNIRTFTDLDLTMIAHPVSGDVVKRYDENAIKLSITNLLLTSPFERPFHPELGSGLNDLLFEPMSQSIAGIMEALVEEMIVNYEPRGQLISVNVLAQEDQNAYTANIRFRVINQQEPINFSVLLRRVR